MKKIGIVGHFGCGLNLLNGQTIKSKILLKEFQRQLGKDNTMIVDTHGGGRRIIAMVINTIKMFQKCENCMVLPAYRGVLFFTPLFFLLNLIYRRKIYYVVIGGWIANYMDEHKWMRGMLKSYTAICVETTTMEKALRERGLVNVELMPNCKELPELSLNDLPDTYTRPLSLCTFSRVMKEKGIENLIDAVKAINEKEGKIVYTLDIYGQVNEHYAGAFEKLQQDFPSYVRYRGCVNYDESVEVLKGYFALVFPTLFYTEGIPGTIIDAYAAGLPVISSRWESFMDVIDDNITGIGYEFKSNDALIQTLEKVSRNPQQMIDMKKDCLKKAKEFSPRVVVTDFIEKYF